MSAKFGVQLSALAAAAVPSGIESYPIIQQKSPEPVCWNRDQKPDPDFQLGTGGKRVQISLNDNISGGKESVIE